MAAWIALIISTISLLVTVISQRDKLVAAMKDFRIWRSEREQKIKAKEVIARLNDGGTETKKEITVEKTSVGTFVLVFFLPLVICSGAASILEINTMISLSTIGAIPFVVSMITIVTRNIAEEKKTKTMKWYYWIIAIVVVLISPSMGATWGVVTFIANDIGLPLLWAGIASAAFFSFLTWLSERGKKYSTAK
jgi:hypothetical protein